MRVAALAMLVLAGCSQLLGLEDTRFDQRDAMVDAPSSCDAAPRCTSASGRSVCGQLFGTGPDAGRPVRVAAPTGERCATLDSQDGPCEYTIFGQSQASYFANNTALRVAGEIDDCGRFVVPDLDAAVDDVVVVVTGPSLVDSGALVFDRPTMVGEDRRVVLPVVAQTTALAWGTQLSAGSPPSIEGGYLVTYINPMGAPLATQELRFNGGAVGLPPGTPWGAYFSGAGAFGTLDAALTTTLESGSALLVPASSAFTLGGFRPGRNCTPVNVQPVTDAFLHVTLSC
jgi:hypothetical protein